MDVPVLLAVTGPGEAALVAALDRTPGVVVVRRCADLGELAAAAAAGHGRAALVSADLHRLDREVLGRLAAAGVAVVGVTSPSGSLDHADGAARLAALGLGHRVTVDAPGPAVAVVVAAAVTASSGAPAGEGGAHRLDDRAAGGRTPLPHSGGEALAAPTSAPPGRLVAVWGPAGAPGRTTVATTLAAELASRLQRAAGAPPAAGPPPDPSAGEVLLADVDTWAASTAQVLGLLDEAAGVAAACRAAATGTLTPERLAQLAPVVLPGLRVLTGLLRAERWPELGPRALEGLWEVARASAGWTVADCAAPLEADEELLLDTTGPRRNGAALSALGAADVVVVVGSADPVGLQRLVRALQDLPDVVSPPSRVVVVTRVRASAVGPGPAARVREALARYAGVDDPVLVPDDRAACDAALLTGRTLTEAAPSSPARVALEGLAERLLREAGQAPASARRRRWARMRR